MKIDPPSIMEGKTPEQNIQAIKGWASELSFQLTNAMTEMQEEISNLREEVKELKEAENGVQE